MKMVYRNLECDNEKTYRWHTVDDIKQPDNPILQSIIKQVKDDIGNILMHIQNRPLHDVAPGLEGITPEMIVDMMGKYKPRIIGIQTIHCQACKHLQVDVIIDDKTKIRKNLWRSYETDRFVKQFMGGNNDRR